MVCIEEISVGDEVLAYDYKTGEKEFKKVLNVWIKETDEILHVSTSDGETIDTTTNHPFYVENKGWVAAGDLEIGDTLVTVDGDEIEVTDIEIEKFAEPILVYNLEIEDFHTYFVGEYNVLVHNMCDGDIDRYGQFNRKSEVGDGIEGHELLQNAWLKVNGYITRRDSGISKDNPALGLTNSVHKYVTSIQRKMGLLNSKNLSKMPLKTVIAKNIDALREAGVSESVIKELKKEISKFISSNGIV